MDSVTWWPCWDPYANKAETAVLLREQAQGAGSSCCSKACICSAERAGARRGALGTVQEKASAVAPVKHPKGTKARAVGGQDMEKGGFSFREAMRSTRAYYSPRYYVGKVVLWTACRLHLLCALVPTSTVTLGNREKRPAFPSVAYICAAMYTM